MKRVAEGLLTLGKIALVFPKVQPKKHDALVLKQDLDRALRRKG